MKEKPSSRKTVLILLSLYAFLYMGYIILPYLRIIDIDPAEDQDMRLKTFLTFSAFLMVYLLSWSNRDVAGMLLIVGFIGSVLLDALLENLRLEAVILGFPVLVIGLFMVRDWYRQLLNLLASIYTLYQIWRTLTYFVVIVDIELIDQVIIMGLMSVWLFGFIFVWKRPFFAGWVFILWFLLLLGTIVLDRGGLEYPVAGVVIGLPGFILGILYLLRGRKKQKGLASSGL